MIIQKLGSKKQIIAARENALLIPMNTLFLFRGKIVKRHPNTEDNKYYVHLIESETNKIHRISATSLSPIEHEVEFK
jgi:hypothetical protein